MHGKHLQIMEQDKEKLKTIGDDISAWSLNAATQKTVQKIHTESLHALNITKTERHFHPQQYYDSQWMSITAETGGA